MSSAANAQSDSPEYAHIDNKASNHNQESANGMKNINYNAAANSSASTTANSIDSHFSNITFEELRQLNDKFIKERNWGQFRSPRNVLLAMVGEVGELAEIFQWKGEVSEGLPELSPEEREHVGQEVSDILIYLTDFASRCKIDLPAAAMKKMEANARKYPADKVYGKANKYTDYQ
ncbi:Dctp pyrophosphatase 1 [Plakobranchus ocellatus]|uniref:Dctp pyrophosphatase 1 n=1 Tax=Plakobranchus ocellatus TaxID=259542 RepID=A0AAV3ZY56_9GAST|nr:Dctp pyrophosphatase 1 [Plakobranchus ocellatus]